MKKRTRFMAGKGLKDITSLNKCSACGRVKRAHLLCPYCVDGTTLTFSLADMGSSDRTWTDTMTAIKTNIFGQLNWAIRRPTTKQSKQMARERRESVRRSYSLEEDPRKTRAKQVLKHTGWKK
jgi:large subunit ribosomal protein L32